MSTVPEEELLIPKPKSSMEARREARIKKIMENSKSRLERLNGEISEPKVKVIYPDPEVESWEQEPITTMPSFQQHGAMETNELLSTLLGSGLGGTPDSDGMPSPSIEHLAQFFQSASFQPQTTQSHTDPAINTRPSKFFLFKLHIILMASVTYLLFYTGNEKYVCYSVLFPLLLWELSEMFLWKTYEKPNQFLNIALMFLKLPPTTTTLLVKTVETFNKVFNDVGVFMFCFTILHLALTWNTQAL